MVLMKMNIYSLKQSTCLFFYIQGTASMNGSALDFNNSRQSKPNHSRAKVLSTQVLFFPFFLVGV